MDKVDSKTRLQRLQTITVINVLILLISAFMAVSTKNHLTWGLVSGLWVLTLTMNLIGMRFEISKSAQNQPNNDISAVPQPDPQSGQAE